MRRPIALVIGLAAVLGATFASWTGVANALSGGTIAPTELSASQQAFTVDYSGKDAAAPNLVITECIANDSKPGFDPDSDCSPLSQMSYFNVVAPAGQVTYGGDPNNPTAPFVGIDPNNGEWSVCAPDSGVTNYQSGFFRLADAADDTADDTFIAFTCAVAEVPEAPFSMLLPVGAAGVLGAAYFIVRNRRRPTAA